MKHFILEHKVALILTLLAAIFAGPLGRFGDELISTVIALNNTFSDYYYARIGSLNEFHVYANIANLTGQILAYVLMVLSFLMLDSSPLNERLDQMEKNNAIIEELTNKVSPKKTKKLTKPEALQQAKAILSENIKILSGSKKSIRVNKLLMYCFMFAVVYFLGHTLFEAKIYREVAAIEQKLAYLEARRGQGFRQEHARIVITNAQTYQAYWEKLKQLESK